MGGPIGLLLKQRPADSVTIVFLLFLDLLTVFFYPAVPKAPFLIGLYSTLILVQVVLIRTKDTGRLVGILHSILFPIICVLLVFDSLGRLVHHISPSDIDPLLIRIDYMMFNNHPAVLLEKIARPWLTDILQVAYACYYFIPITFCIILFRRGMKEEFDRSVFLILLCFYLSYLGYILFPALGPRFYLNDVWATGLNGIFIAEHIERILNLLEGIKRDAFPSGHTAITVLVLWLAFRYDKRYFWTALPVVAGLVFATVYCRYHYVIDVIAGFALTFITLVLGERYYGWWERMRPGSGLAAKKKDK